MLLCGTLLILLFVGMYLVVYKGGNWESFGLDLELSFFIFYILKNLTLFIVFLITLFLGSSKLRLVSIWLSYWKFWIDNLGLILIYVPGISSTSFYPIFAYDLFDIQGKLSLLDSFSMIFVPNWNYLMPGYAIRTLSLFRDPFILDRCLLVLKSFNLLFWYSTLSSKLNKSTLNFFDYTLTQGI